MANVFICQIQDLRVTGLLDDQRATSSLRVSVSGRPKSTLTIPMSAGPDFKLDSSQTLSFAFPSTQAVILSLIMNDDPKGEVSIPIQHFIRSGPHWEGQLSYGSGTLSVAFSLAPAQRYGFVKLQISVDDVTSTRKFMGGVMKLQANLMTQNSEGTLDSFLATTEKVRSKHKAQWVPVRIGLSSFGIAEQPYGLLLHVHDMKKSGERIKVGQATIHSQMVLARDGCASGQLTNDHGEVTGNYKIQTLELTEQPSLIDYIRSGARVLPLIAVDFSATGGTPKLPGSPHQNGGAIEQTIAAFTTALDGCADHDQFSVVAFGGLSGSLPQEPPLPPAQKLLDAVSCKNAGNGTATETTIQSLVPSSNPIEDYSTLRDHVSMWAPGYATPALQLAAEMAQRARPDQFVLLIIIATGEFPDRPEFLKLLQDSAKLPLMVSVVGVGQQDFTVLSHYFEAQAGRFPLPRRAPPELAQRIDSAVVQIPDSRVVTFCEQLDVRGRLQDIPALALRNLGDLCSEHWLVHGVRGTVLESPSH